MYRSWTEQVPERGVWCQGSEVATSSQVYGVATHTQLIDLSTSIQELLLQQGLLRLQLRSRLGGVVGWWGQNLVGS